MKKRKPMKRSAAGAYAAVQAANLYDLALYGGACKAAAHDAMKAAQAAENMERERAMIANATKAAKEFRGKLEAAGISYTTLLDLSAENQELDSMVRNILMGLERGEGMEC
ncbi:MAG: hypothetical protein RSA65_11910 [Clostridia bacterium]